MKAGPSPEVTGLLRAWSAGDEGALAGIVELVYPELRDIARRRLSRERPDHTIQATALVHEAYLRLVDIKRMNCQDRARVFPVGSRVMRRVALKVICLRESLPRPSRSPSRLWSSIESSSQMTGSASVLRACWAPALPDRRNMPIRNRCCLKVTLAWWRGKTRSPSRTGITSTTPANGLSNFIRRGASRRKRPSGAKICSYAKSLPAKTDWRAPR